MTIDKRLGSINMLIESEQKIDSLCPIGEKKKFRGKYEILSSVVDSGATIPVINPVTGEAYEMKESAASKAGVEYEVADGGTLANLGEKLMAVLTAEGTVRGYKTQCANVSKSLQAVRALLSSRHAVCFGLGPEGEDHLIINRDSGEINRMRDDGSNYYQDMVIIPPDEVDHFVDAVKAGQSPFGRPGR